MSYHIRTCCGTHDIQHEISSVSHAAARAADLSLVSDTVFVFDCDHLEGGYLKIRKGAVIRNGALSAGLIEIADILEQNL